MPRPRRRSGRGAAFASGMVVPATGPKPRFAVLPSKYLRDQLVWRAFDHEPPATPDDFRSYAELGIERTTHYLRLMAVSVYLTLGQAQDAATEWNLGDHFAGLALADDKWIT